MTKVVIMSDTHGLTNEINVIKMREQPDYIFHCGDSELQENSSELKGIYTVKGNCDFYGDFPNEMIKTINGLTFLVVHGHLHNVKMNLNNLAYYAEEVNAHIVCFGHSHIAGAEVARGKLFLNPGSVRQPRMRKEKTYAVVKWEDKEEIEVIYYTIEGEIVPELSFKTSLNQ
ncbi:metallophosphoesterase family protein [Ornithinibacillus halotolerans]|uniref:Phosphoesterase n=1 Tax=Ornithinibacillus halotolerans TaxID=1274357 RepID=A0A916S8J3_9BACI|nr:metallophosphoesterase [Ornithinibacillus halotolerans]GGA86089.1 phosphoesterase [Ornithinibacillus halotolerans]